MKSESTTDFSGLQSEPAKNDQLRPNKQVQTFQIAVTEKIKELDYDFNGTITDIYDELCQAINHAADVVLPKVKRKSGVRRKVSKTTRGLYDQAESKTHRTF